MSGLFLSNSLFALSRTDWVEKARKLSEKNQKCVALKPSHAEKDLSGSDLSKADFIGGYFSGDTNFSKANLNKTLFIGAHLKSASFNNANLSEANMYFAYLVGANFTGATLIGTVLNRADLTGANFSKANLKDADLLGTDMDKNTNFSGAMNMSQANKDYAMKKGASNIPK